MAKEPVETEKTSQSSDDEELAEGTTDQGVEVEKQPKQYQLAALWGALDVLDRVKQPTADQEELLREEGLGSFLDNVIEPAAEDSSIKGPPIDYRNEKSLWNQQEKSYPNQHEQRYKDVMLGSALMEKEKKKYRKARGRIDYNESACHQGLPQHQEISRHDAGVLDAEKNPEVKIFSTLASSVLKVPLEFKVGIGTMNKFAVDKAAKNLASVNSNNEKLYFLMAEAKIEKIIAIKHKYEKIEAEYQNGGWKVFGEARENERLDLRREVCVGGLMVKFAEELGRAVRLARQVEDNTRRGGDPNLLAPPVAGSKSKFTSTKRLAAAHDVLTDQGLRSATEISSLLVFGPVGLTVNRCLEYPIDKIAQKVLQAKEKDDKHNAAVALERSRDYQKRKYAGESIDYTLECLSQAINSLNKASAVGSEPTTDFNAGSSISSLSSAGKKQRTPHVSP